MNRVLMLIMMTLNFPITANAWDCKLMEGSWRMETKVHNRDISLVYEPVIITVKNNIFNRMEAPGKQLYHGKTTYGRMAGEKRHCNGGWRGEYSLSSDLKVMTRVRTGFNDDNSTYKDTEIYTRLSPPPKSSAAGDSNISGKCLKGQVHTTPSSSNKLDYKINVTNSCGYQISYRLCVYASDGSRNDFLGWNCGSATGPNAAGWLRPNESRQLMTETWRPDTLFLTAVYRDVHANECDVLSDAVKEVELIESNFSRYMELQRSCGPGGVLSKHMSDLPKNEQIPKQAELPRIQPKPEKEKRGADWDDINCPDTGQIRVDTNTYRLGGVPEWWIAQGQSPSPTVKDVQNAGKLIKQEYMKAQDAATSDELWKKYYELKKLLSCDVIPNINRNYIDHVRIIKHMEAKRVLEERRKAAQPPPNRPLQKTQEKTTVLDGIKERWQEIKDSYNEKKDAVKEYIAEKKQAIKDWWNSLFQIVDTD